MGYVDALSDTHVRLRVLTKFGENSGYQIHCLEDISKVSIDGQYEKKMEKLHDNISKALKEELPYLESSSSNLLIDALAKSQKEKLLVSIYCNELEDSEIGYVKEVDSNAVTLQIIDEFGKEDGLAIIATEDVDSIEFNSKDAQTRRFLMLCSD